MEMHVDENKKFDKRNIERNLKEKIINQKELETYLSKLPDVSDKILIPDGSIEEYEEFKSGSEIENQVKKKGSKRKSVKGKEK